MNERYPKELERRQKRAKALQEAFTSGGNTELDLQRLQAQVRMIDCVSTVSTLTQTPHKHQRIECHALCVA